MEILFNWRNLNDNDAPYWKEISRVELIISKANSIHYDPFTVMKSNPSVVDIHPMSDDENNLYYKLLELPLGVYHFAFQIYLRTGEELVQCSNEYKQTVLANGRKINYIEIGSISPQSTNSFSDCLPRVSEYDSLLPPDNVIVNDDSVTVEQRSTCCCMK